MMRSLQMKSYLVEILRKVVEHFKISPETYYHSILLLNIVKVKKGNEDDRKFYKIPVNRKEDGDTGDGFEDEQNGDIQLGQVKQINVSRQEMPERDKFNLTACLFLAHKLYEPNQLSLSSLMQCIGIESRFLTYIMSLQIQFLYLLRFKIENLLPSNQTLFACQKWDLFVENISNSCVDVKFGIMQLFQRSKQKNTSPNSINPTQIIPKFENIQNQQNIEALTKNIEFIVHNQALYELYLNKSENNLEQSLHAMQKIGLAILYLTILQQSSMSFSKKFEVKKRTQTTGFLDFVFDDFLKSQYRTSLTKLRDEISVVLSILQEITKKQLKCSKQFKYEIHWIEKLNTEILAMTNKSKKNQSHSIQGKDKILQSTLHQSKFSQKADTCVQTFNSLKQENQIVNNLQQFKIINPKFIEKSTQSFMNSFKKRLTRTNIKKNSLTYKRASMTQKNKLKLQQHQGYKVSSFGA